MLKVVKTGPEFLESPVLVLQLGTLLLTLNHKTGRKVGQAHGRIGRVDTLATRA